MSPSETRLYPLVLRFTAEIWLLLGVLPAAFAAASGGEAFAAFKSRVAHRSHASFRLLEGLVKDHTPTGPTTDCGEWAEPHYPPIAVRPQSQLHELQNPT